MMVIMKKFDASKLFRKVEFENYAEFRLAVSLGRVLPIYGYLLDISMMRVDRELIPKSIFEEFHRLVDIGYILVDPSVDVSEVSLPLVEGTEYLGQSSEKVLFKEEDGYLKWSLDIVKELCGTEFYMWYVDMKRVTWNVLDLTSWFVVGKFLGLIGSSKLLLLFEGYHSRNLYYFSNVYACCMSLPWYKELIDLVVKYDGVNPPDMDYEIFCNMAYYAGKYKKYTIDEKRSILLDTLGWKPGSVLIVWERSGICQNSMFGRIKSARVVILKEIRKDCIEFVGVPVNKTKEEVYQEYLEIPEERRSLFSDILDKPLSLYDVELMFTSVGLGWYFYDEEYLVTTLDKNETVKKLVTVDGKEKVVEMSGIDAIYWLMCQYGVDFDKDLYREMYGGENGFLYDAC